MRALIRALSACLVVVAVGCGGVAKIDTARQEGNAQATQPIWETVETLYRATGRMDMPDGFGSGWVAADIKEGCIVITASHVACGKGDAVHHNAIFRYWTGEGVWKEHPILLLAMSARGRPHDVAAYIAVDLHLKPLPLLPFDSDIDVGECLVVGVQHPAPPPMVAVGGVRPRSDKTFQTNGWAWYGHSGGPVYSRSRQAVCGIIAWGAPGRREDAGLTEGPNHKEIHRVLSAAIAVVEDARPKNPAGGK